MKQPQTVRLVRALLLLLIPLTAASRIYLGAHWFSDTLGSSCLGGLLLAPAIWLYSDIRRKKSKRNAGDSYAGTP